MHQFYSVPDTLEKVELIQKYVVQPSLTFKLYCVLVVKSYCKLTSNKRHPQLWPKMKGQTTDEDEVDEGDGEIDDIFAPVQQYTEDDDSGRGRLDLGLGQPGSQNIHLVILWGVDLLYL